MSRAIICCVLFAAISFAGLSSGCGSDVTNTKPASTMTAHDAINAKIEDGTINVKGETDTAPLP
ncbi:hypothetical protein [Thiorhodococcus minor]|uniref:BON domain-containing protein n=1 Tax=Thiorhodococcus minor TaxID=57489 RepID=A0A6M0JSQ5_9GAMM|nr:hypothetical protein [Thiorhodococcus minor]NEV60558.1 hypothetical protein [Thiorhodococcus minor]